MATITKTMKLYLHTDAEANMAFAELTERYRQACNEASEYAFSHGMITNSNRLQSMLYGGIRERYGLKAQLTVSVFKTVTARYKSIETQLKKKPYRFICEGKRYSISRNLTWLRKPVLFSRPQADLVRNRDYSFVSDPDGRHVISLNTLGKRIRVMFSLPERYEEYFMNPEWSLGTGKLVSVKGKWYFHIPATKEVSEAFNPRTPRHVVGIDRGLRFLATLYDDDGRTAFIDGKEIMRRRDMFARQRAELQSRGTKSAKRALKRLSQRENRWMTDVNHRITKALVERYGPGTLFVLEDLSGVSFSERSLSSRSADGRRELSSWAFWQFEQMLSYKAQESGSGVIFVSAEYTSQRCPKCGRIRRENRITKTHEYVCDCCGYRSNDDRAAAMNIQQLGTLYVSGDENPRYGVRRVNGEK